MGFGLVDERGGIFDGNCSISPTGLVTGFRCGYIGVVNESSRAYFSWRLSFIGFNTFVFVCFVFWRAYSLLVPLVSLRITAIGCSRCGDGGAYFGVDIRRARSASFTSHVHRVHAGRNEAPRALTEAAECLD